jgi:hypothetical protein
MMRRAALLLLPLVALSANRPARGEVLVDGFVFARGGETVGQRSWLDGGWGRLRVGAAAPDDSAHFAIGEAQLAVDWQPSFHFGAYAHGLARYEEESLGDEAGLVEAYVHATAYLRERDELRFRLGQFILPTSRENVDPLWATPYTLTYSAINSWIAEEVRPIGLLAEYELTAGERSRLRLGTSAFGGNDTSGALLAWRGWGLQDRLAVLGEWLPLPNLVTLRDGRLFAQQSDRGTRPFGEDLDDRLGWAGYLRWTAGQPGDERAVLQATHFDNRGDRALHVNEYAWKTRFDQLGAEVRLPGETVLAGELMTGETGMGVGRTDLDFEAAYLLLSWSRGPWRLSTRWDRFETEERDFHPQGDVNDETGDAWTFALLYRIGSRVRLGAEWLELSADRPAAVAAGANPDTDGRTVQVEARVSW